MQTFTWSLYVYAFASHETVRDYIINKIQQDFDKPDNIVQSLKTMQSVDMNKNKPKCVRSTLNNEDEVEFEQESCDLVYKIEYTKSKF